MFLVATLKAFGPDELWIAQDMYNIFIQKTGIRLSLTWRNFRNMKASVKDRKEENSFWKQLQGNQGSWKLVNGTFEIVTF